MRFEWDEDKRRSNIAKHGIDFVDALEVFDGRHRLDFESPRGGEQRILSVAQLGERIIAVAWAWRGEEMVRVISVRRARHEEERGYLQLYG